jgi:hypothetical protein
MKYMKSIRAVSVYLVALALSGAVSLKSAEPGQVDTKATVRSITGNCTYTTPGAGALPLKVNMELSAGATITTGPDSKVYLSVNGVSSAVCVLAETTMAIKDMTRVGAAREGDTDTMLDLKLGEIVGNVKKLGANSHYEIQTPHGVAGIRGTDVGVKVVLLPDGAYQVTFTSVQGQLIVSVVINNATVVKVLRTGESWTPGYGDVHPCPIDVINYYRDILLGCPPLPPPGPFTPPPFHILPPYDGNTGPPGQNPSPPAHKPTSPF